MFEKIFFLFIVLIFLFACNKEDIDNDNAAQYEAPNEYTQYKVGNLWVYEVSYCDSLGDNCQPRSWNDSVLVSKDTLINSKKFFKIESSFLGDNRTYYRRDSAHFSIDQFGEKNLSTVLNQKVFRSFAYTQNMDTIYLQKFLMDTTENQIQVKAGSFNCYTMILDIYLPEDRFETTHPTYYHYSKGVGLVKSTHLTIGSLRIIKRELTNYTLN